VAADEQEVAAETRLVLRHPDHEVVVSNQMATGMCRPETMAQSPPARRRPGVNYTWQTPCRRVPSRRRRTSQCQHGLRRVFA
jgi:hypothetical protein